MEGYGVEITKNGERFEGVFKKGKRDSESIEESYEKK
jgi:hypothetical protein